MKENDEIIEKVLKEVSDQDGWCAFCKNGLETGEDFCEECSERVKQAIQKALTMKDEKFAEFILSGFGSDEKGVEK